MVNASFSLVRAYLAGPVGCRALATRAACTSGAMQATSPSDGTVRSDLPPVLLRGVQVVQPWLYRV